MSRPIIFILLAFLAIFAIYEAWKNGVFGGLLGSATAAHVPGVSVNSEINYASGPSTLPPPNNLKGILSFFGSPVRPAPQTGSIAAGNLPVGF